MIINFQLRSTFYIILLAVLILSSTSSATPLKFAQGKTCKKYLCQTFIERPNKEQQNKAKLEKPIPIGQDCKLQKYILCLAIGERDFGGLINERGEYRYSTWFIFHANGPE